MVLFILLLLKILALFLAPTEPLLAAFVPEMFFLFFAWSFVNYVSALYTVAIIAFALVWIITPWMILAESRLLRLIGLWTVLLLNFFDLSYIVFSPFSLMKIVGLLFNVAILFFAAMKLSKER